VLLDFAEPQNEVTKVCVRNELEDVAWADMEEFAKWCDCYRPTHSMTCINDTSLQ